ncbi:hypothetical protein T439DRAFT_166414 [Meredithblackwellia eburnea MCA 4105]
MLSWQCGDASMYTLSLTSAATENNNTPESAESQSAGHTMPSLQEAVALGLSISRSDTITQTSTETSTAIPSGIHRGRMSFATLGALRTKPGRADSLPTSSHSCSDKIAKWALVGIQGGLLASLGVGAVKLHHIIIGGVQRDIRERVATEVRRAVGTRVRITGPEIGFTDLAFEHSGAEAFGKEMVSCPDCKWHDK